jgi:hypothetical protein
MPALYEGLIRLRSMRGVPLVTSLKDFTASSISKTYLKCFFDVKNGKAKQKSYALNKDIPKRLRSALGGTVQVTEKAAGGYLLINGRWIDGGKVFATLGDENKYKEVCAKALEREYKSAASAQEPDKIHMSVGNTRWTDDAPIVYYKPMLKRGAKVFLPPKMVQGLYDLILQDPVEYCASLDRDCYPKDWVAVFIDINSSGKSPH